jgi:outer membrane protein OmpA-like peptidoglycan-associated protein
MHNEHETNHLAPGFGKNTNGAGIFLLGAIFVVLGLFVWWLWNNNHKEFDYYRIENAAGGHDEHGGGHRADAGNLKPLGMLDTVTGNYIYEIGEEMEIILPDSAKTVLVVGKNSTEARLYKFLTDDNAKVDTVDKTQGWITCDRIFFTTNHTDLTEDSKHQIERLGAILKAFGNAEIKVGGYTDSTGAADVNTKLSTGRALAVATQLQTVSGRNKIESEGYGPLHPIAANDTPEGRAMNRRVDLRVIKK